MEAWRPVLHCFLYSRDTNHITGSRLIADDSSFLQCLDRFPDGVMAHTSDILWETHSFEPFPRVRLRVIKVCADVFCGLVRMCIKVFDAFINPLEHGCQPLILRVLCNNLPRTPRRVDFPGSLNLPVIIILLGREVFPHEEVGRAIIDAISKFGECLQRNYLERRFARSLEPPFGIGQHKPHDIGSTSNRQHS